MESQSRSNSAERKTPTIFGDLENIEFAIVPTICEKLPNMGITNMRVCSTVGVANSNRSALRVYII